MREVNAIKSVVAKSWNWSLHDELGRGEILEFIINSWYFLTYSNCFLEVFLEKYKQVGIFDQVQEVCLFI